MTKTGRCCRQHQFTPVRVIAAASVTGPIGKSMAQRPDDQQQMLLAQGSYSSLQPGPQGSQHAILDSNEQGFIESFFNNPEHAASQQGIGDEATFAALYGIYNPFNFAMEASLPASSHTSGRAGGQMAQLSANENWFLANNDVTNAASALAGFQNGAHSASQPMNHNGSWNQVNSTSRVNGASEAAGTQQYPFSNLNYQAPPAWQHTQGTESSLSGHMQRTRHLSLDTSASSFSQGQHQNSHPVPHSAIQGRPSKVSFGTDINFSPQGWQGPDYNHTLHSRSDALLNIPFATQASSPPYQPSASQKPQGSTTSHLLGAAQLASMGSVASVPAALRGVEQRLGPSNAHDAQPGEREQSEQQQTQQPTRKRRKVHLAETDDVETSTGNDADAAPKKKQSKPKMKAEDDLDASTVLGAKRRKSAHAPVTASSPQSAQSSDGDDDADEHPSATKKKDKKPRQNLSDKQKRENHIMSEKKRRELIKTGYADLNRLVPSLIGGKAGMSRSESLFECQTYLESLVNGSRHVMQALGIRPTDLPFSVSGDGD